MSHGLLGVRVPRPPPTCNVALSSQLEAALQRSFYTAKNGHAWTMNDHKMLVDAVAAFERQVAITRPAAGPTRRAVAVQRRRWGRA